MKTFSTLKIFFFLLILINSAWAQSGSLSLEILQQKFKNFQYDSVLTMADRLLQHKDQFKSDELIEIYRMKAIAHYAKLEMNASLSSFVEILKIDPGYSLDPITTSPKIIKFFNEIKANLQTEQAHAVQRPQPVRVDTVIRQSNAQPIFRNAIMRSMLLPGWGHLYLGNGKKGWLLSAVSTATLASAFYFIRDCQNKERDYLNEIDLAEIDARYDRYNQSYKIRNFLIAGYALVWAYSQIDILFFQQERVEQKVRFSLTLPSYPGRTLRLRCAVRF